MNLVSNYQNDVSLGLKADDVSTDFHMSGVCFCARVFVHKSGYSPLYKLLLCGRTRTWRDHRHHVTNPHDTRATPTASQEAFSHLPLADLACTVTRPMGRGSGSCWVARCTLEAPMDSWDGEKVRCGPLNHIFFVRKNTSRL